MTTNRSPQRTLAALAVGTLLAALLFCVATARGAAPTCTGDRHYDETGACCPVVESCPDPAPCPAVTCDCTYEGGTTNYITVNRCPDIPACPASSVCPAFVAPRYQVCKVKRDGTLRCPHPRAPRRVFVPLS